MEIEEDHINGPVNMIAKNNKRNDKTTAGYIRAAELIATRGEVFSCCAIVQAFRYNEPFWWLRRDELRVYLKIFSTIPSSPENLYLEIEKSPENERQELRQMLLLMMAACWEDFKGE